MTIPSLTLATALGLAGAAPSAQAVSATDLINAFDQNELRAEAHFEDKTLAITGRVGDIATDLFGTPYVTLESGDDFQFRSVQCFFSRSDKSLLASLNPGQRISFRGRVDGLMMNVLVKDCSIVRSPG